VFEQIEDLEPGEGCFEPDALEIAGLAHG
jgi:hypothetical protein